MNLVIADTGALISLGLVGCIDSIVKVFGEFYIPNAVWEELQQYKNSLFDDKLFVYLEKRVKQIHSKNHLISIMDYGESESVLLYEELDADYLLIDDHRARIIAESMEINCIGSIGLLLKAKEKGFLDELKPVFSKWLIHNRYFSKKLLNMILIKVGETSIDD